MVLIGLIKKCSYNELLLIFKLKILNRLMGQDAMGCCDRGAKLDQ